MKQLIFITALAFATYVTTAQKLNEADVPATVKDAFAKKYPGHKAKWEKEGTDYEAEFELNKVESSVVFDGNGGFKELEQEIKLTELPAAAKEYCTKNYPGCKMEEAEKITDANGKIQFETEMKKGKEGFDLLFDEHGTFIKKEMDMGGSND